jgi:aspartate/methionine/tyrosine aminotransferase
VRRIVATHQYLVTCAPSIAQYAALAAFSPAGQAERVRYREFASSLPTARSTSSSIFPPTGIRWSSRGGSSRGERS